MMVWNVAGGHCGSGGVKGGSGACKTNLGKIDLPKTSKIPTRKMFWKKIQIIQKSKERLC